MAILPEKISVNVITPALLAAMAVMGAVAINVLFSVSAI